MGNASFMAFIIHSPVTAGSFWLVKAVPGGVLTHFVLSAVFSVPVSFALADMLTRFFSRWKEYRRTALSGGTNPMPVETSSNIKGNV
jgi:peptidoglycan/LPS O-acetylase OafA/YrhL